MEREVGEISGGRQRDGKLGGKETAQGDGCTMQCADDVLLSCTLETCVVFQTNVTPIKSIKIVFFCHYILKIYIRNPM